MYHGFRKMGNILKSKTSKIVISWFQELEDWADECVGIEMV